MLKSRSEGGRIFFQPFNSDLLYGLQDRSQLHQGSTMPKKKNIS
uniref:Uncharacterized protein n=1 Tax=Rhizophora mucronata TaxID=61149 RepID=A0A2P2QGJ1_RHIMU